MGATNGGNNWCWIFAIITAFFCSCCDISAISTAIVSTGVFDGELSWVEGVSDADIKEKYGIVDGSISGSLGEIVLVIGIPGWRRSHAASE